jgi:hypothetical protein
MKLANKSVIKWASNNSINSELTLKVEQMQMLSARFLVKSIAMNWAKKLKIPSPTKKN